MEKETCMICLDDLYNGTDVLQTICEHKFHRDCLIGIVTVLNLHFVKR